MSSELSAAAKKLVNAGRAALSPTSADKARIATALQAKLQAPETAGDAAAEVPQPAGLNVAKSPWLGKGLVWTGGVAISVAAAAYYILPTSQTDFPPNDGVVATSPKEAVPAAPALEVSSVLPPVALKPDAATPAQLANASNSKTAPRATTGDRLGEEAALLARAEKAFHSGDFKRALALTNEHRAKFPKGLLTRERIHLRVEALCSLGRHEEADKQLARGGVKSIKACGRKP